MRFYWIRNRTSQGQFLIYWQTGITNLGDYHTKHHSPEHHQLMQPTYLHTYKQLAQCAIAQCAIAHILRGCIKSRAPTTVRHGSSFHRICLKLLTRVPDVCPFTDAKTIDSSPSRLESQTSVRQPTLKIFGSSPSRLKSQTSVCRTTLKLFGSSPSRLSFDRRRNC